MSYMHKVGSEPLRAITLGSLLEEVAQKYPERDAVVALYQNKRITYRELLAEADKFAIGLRTLGIEKGDRIGIWAPNLAEWIIVAAAIARLGCISVAINQAFQAQELKYCIKKVGIKALVCPKEIKKAKFYDILCEISPAIANSEPGKFNCIDIPSLSIIITISEESLKGTYSYNEVQNLGETALAQCISREQNLIPPDSVCNIQFTSGTTGQPKAVLLSHFSVVNNAYYMGKRNELDKKYHKICVQIPLFHVFGVTITIASSFHFGSTMILPSPLYSSDDNLKALEEEKCTIIFGTPTMYIDLVDLQKQRNLNINPEIAVWGGASCSPKFLKEIKEILKIKTVKSVYGLTETTAGIFQSLPVDEDEHKVMSTVGQVQDHLEVKVVDADDNIVPLGMPGELCIRGYTVMLGYWEDETKTKEVIGPNGWLRTGDQFVLHEDGYGMIVGRLKDVIIRGGENIYPKEVEDLLNTHPHILESYVVGLDHERLGEEVCACVRLRNGVQLSLEELVAFCKGKIAHFKIPSKLRIVEKFPKTTSGKIQKFKLKELIEKAK